MAAIRTISCTYTHENDGETWVARIELYVGGAIVTRVQEWLDDNYPSSYCQHSHDCCGNFYASKAQIKFFDGNRCVVEQRANLNI